jgi:hypothetical protein
VRQEVSSFEKMEDLSFELLKDDDISKIQDILNKNQEGQRELIIQAVPGIEKNLLNECKALLLASSLFQFEEVNQLLLKIYGDIADLLDDIVASPDADFPKITTLLLSPAGSQKFHKWFINPRIRLRLARLYFWTIFEFHGQGLPSYLERIILNTPFNKRKTFAEKCFKIYLSETKWIAGQKPPEKKSFIDLSEQSVHRLTVDLLVGYGAAIPEKFYRYVKK